MKVIFIDNYFRIFIDCLAVICLDDLFLIIFNLHSQIIANRNIHDLGDILGIINTNIKNLVFVYMLRIVQFNSEQFVLQDML